MVNAMEAKGLTVTAPGGTLLDALSFTIAPGERVGLIGQSGSGKSLTAAVLCGLLRPPLRLTTGTLILNGTSMQANPRHWREVRGRQIFQIFQSPASALTPARRIGPQLRETARIAGAPSTRITEALDQVGLSQTVTGQFPYQLSGGMKQRVLIAMALILRPTILIADEPTTGLDVLTEGEVLDALRDMLDETSAALLFISHDLRAVQAVADRVLVMEGGKLVEDCVASALLQSRAPAAQALSEAAEILQTPC